MVDIVKQMASDPESTFSSVGFVPGTGASGVNQVFGSGSCGIKSTQVSSGIYQLDPDFSSRGHYFFPYGVYKQPIPVHVQFGQPDGTAVFTAPMNGCSLQVNKCNSYFTFYHDAMSESMSGTEPGEIVCRVGPKDYDKLDLGQKEVVGLRATKFGGTYGVGVFTIHHQGRWKVYTSFVSFGYDKSGNINPSTAKRSTAATSNLITSFADG